MFREFIYLDMDRIQSIIAQLNEGLLTDIASGSQKDISAKAGTDSLILSHLLAVEGQGKYTTDKRETRVMHDYAFNLAFKSLQNERLILENIDNSKRESFPGTESAFVLTTGQARLYDFSILERLWSKKWSLDHAGSENSTSRPRRYSTSQRKRIAPNEALEPNAARAMFETFYNDTFLVSITNSLGVAFMGLIYRQHLREDIRSLIFKYGARPQGQWTMLAQICSIPEPKKSSVQQEVAHLSEGIEMLMTDQTRNWSEFITDLLERANEFQETMGTVVFPNISVSPIAIYRKVTPL